MKKLMVAAILASSMVAAADEVKTAEKEPAVSAEACAKKCGGLTPEQRAEMRAKREKFMAERKTEMEKQAIEVIKKYGLDDEKAKALLKELEESMRPGRRPRPPMKLAEKPAAESAPKAE